MAAPVAAQEIQLLSPSGDVDLRGTLVSFEDGYFTIETSFGRVSVDGALVECVGPGCPPDVERIQVAGADALGAHLLPHLIEGYAANAGFRVERTEGDGSQLLRAESDRGDRPFEVELPIDGSGGFDGLLDGSVALAAAALPPLGRAPTEAEAAGLAGLAALGRATPIAVDGLVFVLHPDNPIDNLTMDEITALLTGAVTDWSSLGGPDVPVEVFAPPEGSLKAAAVDAYVLDPFEGNLTQNATRLGDVGAVAEAVAGSLGAFGIVGLTEVGAAKPAGIAGVCGLTPPPTPFAAVAGEYPLHRPLNLYAADVELGRMASALHDFARSPAAAEAIRAAGFLDLGILREDQLGVARRIRSAIDIAADEDEVHLLRELYIDLLEWDRLSTTFRFPLDGALQLEPGSERQMAELADYLADLPIGVDIALIGFSGRGGNFRDRVDASAARAEAVLDALMNQESADDLRRKTILVKGFGDLKSVGCFADARGEELNRRVEVWVRR